MLMVTAGAPEAGAVDLLPSLVVGRVVGSHHFVQLEVADQVAAMVERFLAVCGDGVDGVNGVDADGANGTPRADAVDR